jgi:hypothetical protein
MQKSAAFLMVTVLLLGLLIMSESRSSPSMRSIENTFADWVTTNATRSVPRAHVVLVEINDSTLLTDPLPWPPISFALFLQSMLQLRPEVVAIEPTLNPDDTPLRGAALLKREQSRKILHDLILQTPKLILGSRLGFPGDPEVVPPTLPVPLLRNIKGDITAIPVFTDIEQQAPEDYRWSAAVGFVNIPAPARGEITRKVPLVFSYRGEIVPSLALQALIQWFKVTPDEVIVEPGNAITLGKKAGIPVDSAGRMNVDFSSPFTRFGYDDLLLAVELQQQKQTPSIPLDALKGSIALLACTDKASRTFLLPNRETESSGELCARAIATVQNKGFSRRISRAFDSAVIVVMMALSCFFHHVSTRRFLFFSLLAIPAYLFLGLAVYSVALVWIPFVLPMGLLFVVNLFNYFMPRPTPIP